MHRLVQVAVAFTILLLATVAPLRTTGSGAPLAAQMTTEGSDVGARIDRCLSAMEPLGFSGAILVEHRGEVVLRKGYGLANRETRRPYTPATVQTHGSLTKQITAAAVLLLESRGQLSVDDTLDRHFQDLPADKRDVTIHQLLTHSSGLPGSTGLDEEPIGGEECLELIREMPLEFEPGTGYGYSNTGYTLLGLVVERVSGKEYETFVREELLLPAGLTETGYVLPDWEEDRLASGYHRGDLWGRVHGRGWRDDGPGWHLRANGGMHTTVDDMHRWLDTLRGEGPLGPDLARRWTTGYVSEGGDSDYAYGWVVQDTEWGEMISHAGSNRIFSADFVWLPEAQLFFYIQGNTSMVPARLQRGRLLAAAFDPEFPMPPLVEPDPDARPEVAEARVGTYDLDEGSLELMADDTRLIAKLWGQPALDLLRSPTEEERERFIELDRRVRDAMDRLEAGREDAFSDLVDEDAVPIARSFLNRIERIGGLQALHVIGTFANEPGSRYEGLGPWTTFVYAEFADWNQYWNLIWNEDGTYRGNWSGPWPSFTLVPTGPDRYRAVEQEAPWHAIDLRLEGGCLVGEGLEACREGSE